ncbi:MAG: transglutaminase domain-containing protein, partial [Bacteroidia bacterium]|nr:transglutaminase domain-containing protein [Bacteroidia bacterium]
MVNSDISTFIQPSLFIDNTHPDVLAEKDKVVSESDSTQEKIIKLYLHVRDKWRYNPYKLDLRKEQMRASEIIKRPEAYCIEKAILYAALVRAAGIPAKVGFANVINHIGTEKLEEVLKTNMLVFHGYTLVHYNNQWRVATPAFNKELCELLNVDVLEFDGTEDSMLQHFSKEGDKYMEYVHDYG